MHYQSKQNGNLSITQQQLIALLPDKFTTREAMGIAQTLGVSGKTAERWLNDWTKKLDIQRIRKGLHLEKTSQYAIREVREVRDSLGSLAVYYMHDSLISLTSLTCKMIAT